MIRKMAPVEIVRPVTVRNELQEVVRSDYEVVATVEMAICLMHGSTVAANNVMTVDSTHVGVTNYRGEFGEADLVRRGDELYGIDYIDRGGRHAILYLRRVTAR